MAYSAPWLGAQISVQTQHASGAWVTPKLHSKNDKLYLEVEPASTYRVVGDNMGSTMVAFKVFVDGQQVGFLMAANPMGSATISGWQLDVHDSSRVKPLEFAKVDVSDDVSLSGNVDLGTIKVEVWDAVSVAPYYTTFTIATASGALVSSNKKAIERGIGTDVPRLREYGVTSAQKEFSIQATTKKGEVTLLYRDRAGLLLLGIIQGATGEDVRKSSSSSSSSSSSQSMSSSSSSASGSSKLAGSKRPALEGVDFVAIGDGDSTITWLMKPMKVALNDGQLKEVRTVMVPLKAPEFGSLSGGGSSSSNGGGKGRKKSKPAKKKSDSDDSDIELVGEFGPDGEAIDTARDVGAPPGYSMNKLLTAIATAFSVSVYDSAGASAMVVSEPGSSSSSSSSSSSGGTAGTGRLWDDDGNELESVGAVLEAVEDGGLVVWDASPKAKFKKLKCL